MKQRGKRSLSFCLALTMCLSMFSGTGLAAEGTEKEAAEPQASATYEPWVHGYRFVDVLNFDPENDPYSEELKAHVPLQERNEAFSATQANPNLTEDTSLYPISGGNYRSTGESNAPYNGNMAYDDFSYSAFKFWQYTDFVGAGGRPTSGIDRDASQKEYGTVSVPIPAYINAAHKNGARVLAEYFVPRTPQYTEEWLYKDENGNFPYAQKLVDMMNYYGYDGYFINQEESIAASYVPLFREMLAWMREQGCYIQWYDSLTDRGGVAYQNHFNDSNSNWVWNEENGRVSDSIFLNYWNDASNMQRDADYALSLGLDPHEVVFYGFEGNQWNFGRDLDGLLDDTGNSILSFGIWGSDFYREDFDKTDNNRYKSQYQWAAEERERMFYGSRTENADDFSDVNRSDVGVSASAFKGFARYIAERSVIDGTTFTSNFNNGHGMQYFQNGEVIRDIEWTNVNIQDILPTWQWWIEGGEVKLDMDWDYGPTYERIVDGAVLPFEYEQIGAYNGGSSLVAFGDLEGENYIHLYKTDLDIKDSSSISLTYNKPSATDASTMQLALIFKNAPNDPVYLPIENAGEQTDGWKTVELSLGQYAGEELAAIGVQIDTETAISDYQVNFGQIKVSDGSSYTPDAPEGFQIDRIFDETGEVQVSWELGDYDQVQQYNLYAAYADGSERFVGGAYADNYYIQNLEDRENIVSLKLRAVGKDGSESEAAEAAFNGNGVIRNILAVSENNQLNVTWDEGEGDFDSVEVTLEYFYEDREPVSVTVEKGAKNAQLEVPVEDGSKYVLTLSTDAGKANYFGTLADNYCEPYDGFMRLNEEEQMNLTMPSSSDWSSMTLERADGSTQTFNRFNGDAPRGLALPETNEILTVTVEDTHGNRSEPVTFVNMVQAALDEPVPEALMPDEALRQAVTEQAGATLQEVMAYTGTLNLSGTDVSDLTGLGLLSNLTGLDVSHTEITAITAGMLWPSLTEINLEGCTALEELCLTGTQVKALDITDSTNLSILDADNSSLETIDHAAASDYTNLYRFNFSGSKLDLSEGTPERQFMDELNGYIEENPIEPVMGLTGNLALNGETDNDRYQTLIDGDNKTGGISIYEGDSAVIDLGTTSTVKQWALYCSSFSYPESCMLEVSTDGVTYTQVGEIVEMEDSSFTVELTEDQYATGRYFRFTPVSGGGAIREIELYGDAPIPYGLTCDSQRPAAYADIPEELKLTVDKDDTIRTMDYFENGYKNIITVRGTPFASLEGADWIAADYDLASQMVMPENVSVVITNQEGDIINLPGITELPDVDVKTNVSLNAQILGGSGQNSGEEYDKMFDGDTSTKWCVSNMDGWTAFALAQPEKIGRWVTKHAEIIGESVDYNTGDFELQVLNTEALGMTEEEFLASDSAADSSVLSNDENWITIDHVTENKAMIVDRTVETPVEARVYRLKVNEGVNESTRYTAVRLHELEMYRADLTPKDYDGILKLDQAGKYTVDFMKDGDILDTMEVYLSADKALLQAAYDYAAAQDTSKLIESVKAMYDQALSNAEAVLANAVATEEEVWDAIDQLFEAVWSLGFVQGDKTNLGLLIERAEAMDADKYVADNWQQLVDALAEAKAVYEDGDAMDEDIQPVAEALLNAILAQRYKADKSILEDLINQANEIDTSLYTAESVQAFTAALKSANAILADESLSEDDQETVDEAVATLSNAMDNLEKLSSDNGTTGSGDDNKDDSNISDKDDTSSKDDPNKGPMDDSKNPATGDTTFALAALAVLLTSAGAFVVIRRKSRV